MKPPPPLTPERLRELLLCDPSTGSFTWLVNRPGPARAGDEAGCFSAHKMGYVLIKVDQQLYLRHRLVWFWVHGRWPAEQLDHIDGHPGNDWIENLREATASENCANSRRPKHNSTGFKGVYYSKTARKFVARITYKRRMLHLGCFEDAEAAHAVYCAAASEIFGPFARTA